MKDYHSRESFLHKLFEMRMNAITKEAYYEKGCSLLDLYADLLGENDYLYLKSLLEFFFFEDKGNNEWRKTLSSVSFNDFSLANIFYSSAAAMNGNSLRLAGKDIAKVLDIKDNVHLISDVNLFLKAYTESGHLIEDEGDIVKWDNPNDKIQEVFLEKEGEEYVPHVDEGTDLVKVKSCEELIKNADIIIFSSGTQWSSLIPTYMHSGFRKILEKSDAKKYLVVNNVEDHDMKGVNADRIIEILGKYIPLDSVTAVVNDDAVEGMDKVYKIKNIHAHIGGEKDKHDPKKLIQLIMKDYFGLTEKEKTYVYDLDGTIWDERANEKGKLIGKQNLKLFKGIIHSGNRYEHVRDVFKYMYDRDDVVHIYSDFGNVHFTSNDFTKNFMSNRYFIDESICIELEKIEAFRGKVSIRGGGTVITIKPLVNRGMWIHAVNRCLQKFGGLFVARISGNTSIDITHRDYNKKTMLLEILKEHKLNKDDIVFVGNETIEGSEAAIADAGIKTIQVNDIYECNVLLNTIACE